MKLSLKNIAITLGIAAAAAAAAVITTMSTKKATSLHSKDLENSENIRDDSVGQKELDEDILYV